MAEENTVLSPEALFIEGYQGVKIRVWDFGGDGPPLLLSHCTGTHGRVWDPLVPELANRFHVYALDTRGHGDSDKPEEESAYLLENFGEDILALVDALELGDHVHTVGHSAGASSLCYASWKRPTIFKRAVLIDPILGPSQGFQGENPLAKASRRRKNDFPDRATAEARYASKPPMQSWDPRVLTAYVEHGFRETEDGQITLKCQGPIEAMVYDALEPGEVFDHLAELPLEVCLVTGEHSNVARMAEMQRERFRSVEYHVLAGAGHFIPQEKPDEVTQLILDWLE